MDCKLKGFKRETELLEESIEDLIYKFLDKYPSIGKMKVLSKDDWDINPPYNYIISIKVELTF